MEKLQVSRKLIVIIALFGVLQAPQTYAGVFNLAQFVSPGEFALGLEPEVILTHGAGLGVNLRYTQGVNELMNFTGLLGTGGGPRRFRVGGNVAFDFFPDIEGQPGIGLALQGIYYRMAESFGQFEVTAIPYLHKTFMSGSSEVNPFVSIPFGIAFSEGQYKTISTVAVGAMFKQSEHIRYTTEFGVAVNNAESYLSVGVTYYH